jgi:MTH538 TIR-like domain (DUF1863)
VIVWITPFALINRKLTTELKRGTGMRGTSRLLSHPLRAVAGLNRAGRRQNPAPRVLDQPRYSYWAFISYARSDEPWAKSLHRRLEAFRIPREMRPASAAGIPSTRRLRPVFRDDDELPASADLGGRLRDALDRSRYLIVLASPAAAASRWVNAEVQQFLDAGRIDDVLVLAIDGEPGGAPEREALPAALKRPAGEPLWVDARKNSKLDRKTIVRLVAGMLGTGFDALWQRDRRRRRRQLATWLAATLVLSGMIGGVIWQQQKIADRNKPQRQVAAFRQFVVADGLKASRDVYPDFKASDLVIDIVRTEDLNGDSLLDFFVFNGTVTFCGSGGCAMEVYISLGGGRYRNVLDLFGYSTPRTRIAESGDYREIVATHYMIESEPIYTTFRWTGENYELSRHEFCNGVWIEYCDPVTITPIDQAASERLTVASRAVYLRKPKTSAPRTEYQSGPTASVIGEISSGGWYLVDLGKGYSAFVSRRYVRRG